MHTDAQALIVAGCFSVGWILLQFIRQRTVDVVGVAVLVGFVVGVITSTLLGGNAYMLKVRDGFFTLLFGIACIVTLYTHDRPAFFYVNRYLSAGNDPFKVSAFDRLHELPVGRHTFRTLSVVWGIGLVVEASSRLTLADLVAHRDVPGRLAVHHRHRHRQPVRLHHRLHEADADRVGRPHEAPRPRGRLRRRTLHPHLRPAPTPPRTATPTGQHRPHAADPLPPSTRVRTAGPETSRRGERAGGKVPRTLNESVHSFGGDSPPISSSSGARAATECGSQERAGWHRSGGEIEHS